MGKFEKIMAEVLGIEPGQINDETSPLNTPSWDSMNGLLIVTEMEKGYDMKFTIDEVMSIKSAGHIKEILKNHNINLDGNN